MDLEKLVAQQTIYKLRDFVKFMAGGITPKVTDKGQYYSDSDNGVPFLRVQNLSPEGLDCTDCKYITKETHNGMLKRSRIFPNDLLIKITGVGRMAITSIAPEGFVGNINQHIVVVRTKEKELNEQIAAFLNSDIGEMLAAHRATGGTRPALDYTALRSIPIILNEDAPIIMKRAYEEKREKEKQAEELLSSIDKYLLQELGIMLPLEEKNGLENRMYYVSSNKILGDRFDPRKYNKKYQCLFSAIENTPFSRKPLKDLITDSISGNWGKDESVTDENLVCCLTIRATEFDNKYNLNLDSNRVKFRKYEPEIYERIKLLPNDILIEKSGGSDNQPVGRVAFIEKEMIKAQSLAYSNFIQKIVINEDIAIPRYVYEYLRLIHNIKLTEVMQTQTNGIRNLIMKEYLNLDIILPKKDKQKTIVKEILRRREQASKIKTQADLIIEKASLQLKKLLLGEK